MSERKRKKRISIDKETEIFIQSNLGGSFFWEDVHKTTFIKFEERGDEETVTFGELRTMLSQLRPYFTDMRLIISDVLDEDVSIMDVATALHIEKTYEDYFEYIEDVDLDSVDNSTTIASSDFEYFIKESDIEDYKKALKSSVKNPIIENSVDIYRKDRSLDGEKMDLISRIIDDKEDLFWNDVKASQEG
ncbi:MAG: hypothetical protein ABF991_00765 [Liquorilactobacillus hordei]|uniref:hypothetical protein n=1 Tax=Liquorilactobacillus hordei TaxID=468911 RepID=UPI0039ECE3FC